MEYLVTGHASIDGLPHIYWEYGVHYELDHGADYEIEGAFYRRIADGEVLEISYSDDDFSEGYTSDLSEDLKKVYIKDCVGEYISVYSHILAMAEYDEREGRGEFR
jgi:hypothetical protein